jgi:hypothetical protein
MIPIPQNQDIHLLHVNSSLLIDLKGILLFSISHSFFFVGFGLFTGAFFLASCAKLGSVREIILMPIIHKKNIDILNIHFFSISKL